MLKITLISLLVFAGCVTSQESQNLLSYRKIRLSEQSVHLVTLSREKYTMSIERSLKDRETVSSIAGRTMADVAVNGGFFHADGRPAGVLKVINKLYSCPASRQRGALLWNEQKAVADRILCPEAGDPKGLLGEDPGDYPNILGGVPLLIYRGKKLPEMESEKAAENFMKNRYARTAVGIKGDEIMIVLVDGSSTAEKNTGVYRGFSVAELVDFFLQKGVDYAVNLDGGGSSTLVIDGKVVNAVANEERPVSEAIIFRRR